MPVSVNYLKYPELVFGIAGPIGIDVDLITRVLSETLKTVGYRSSLIKITDEIASRDSGVRKPDSASFFNTMKYKMEHASAICRKERDAKFLMRLAVAAIKRERINFIEAGDPSLSTPDDEVGSVEFEIEGDDPSIFLSMLAASGDDIALRSAYIIRQIKRPEEVVFLRGIYGDQFVLISAYGSENDRQKDLEEKIRSSARSPIKDARVAFLAMRLIAADMDEERDVYGQHMRDAFHLADVVIEGIDKTKLTEDLKRFIDALFGSNEIGPTRLEHGMNAASAASLRSLDLSRQVGAVIFSPQGDIIAQGCNEVPRAGGGTYWEGESPDFRDIKLGQDSNDILKMDVLRDLVDRLRRGNLLAPEVLKLGSALQIADFLVGRGDKVEKFEKIRGALKSSKILDLTEYGRVVHAEMAAICDAARSGRALTQAVLYCTTFPCHNCTKHIIATGMKNVYFLEPYPKSKAKELHSHEISIEELDESKVSFMPFKGITPRRFSRVFKKGKRKLNGRSVKWQFGGPAPMVDVGTTAYLQVEEIVMHAADEDPAGSSGITPHAS